MTHIKNTTRIQQKYEIQNIYDFHKKYTKKIRVLDWSADDCPFIHAFRYVS